MLKIQFKHSKSVNGGARQVKRDSSVKRDFRSSSRPYLIRQPSPPFVGGEIWSTQISGWSFNQSLMDDYLKAYWCGSLDIWSDRNEILQVMFFLYLMGVTGPAPL